MPKLDGTHLPERLRTRLDALKAGEEVAARDIRALLSHEQIDAMDAAWDEQQALRKKKAKTKEEEKELGRKTKREIHIEAYEQALQVAEGEVLAALKDRIKKNEMRAARIYLDGYCKALEEGKDRYQAETVANNDLKRAHLSKVGNVLGNMRDKEVRAMEDAIRAEMRKNMTADELEQLEAMEEHEKVLVKNRANAGGKAEKASK